MTSATPISNFSNMQDLQHYTTQNKMLMLTCGLGQAVSVAVVTEFPLLQMKNIVYGNIFIITDHRDKSF